MDEWTRSPFADGPDVDDAVAALGPAFAAAEMAGRYDVEESPVELASASLNHVKQPFRAQVDFFRAKLDMTTRAWTDIWHDEHDRAFVVAGAAQANLVEDLRQAVDSAIAEGTTIRKFRQAFDGIVAKHGWSYKGGRNWRTRVIYDTNVRSSYSAGRYRQMKEGAERRPFWRYRHSHASETPRPKHLAWDGMVLRHDDPWWETHYPINGWGCKCYVEALNARDLERLGKDGPDTAPTIRTREVTVGARGPSPRTVRVPEGIDPGFAYAPGASNWRTELQPVIETTFGNDPVAYVAEGRRIREELVAAAGGIEGDGFEGQFRRALRRKLREERGAGKTAGAIEVMNIRGAKVTAERVRRAAAELPESWVKAANTNGTLHSRGTSKRGGHGRWPGREGEYLITTNKDPGNALHEYTHHLQNTVPGLDALFHKVHRRRTKGEERIFIYEVTNEVGRRDKYLDDYVGREYDSPGMAEAPLEVLTMTMQMAFHPIFGKDYLKDLAGAKEGDTELLDLLLGVLFNYDP